MFFGVGDLIEHVLPASIWATQNGYEMRDGISEVYNANVDSTVPHMELNKEVRPVDLRKLISYQGKETLYDVAIYTTDFIHVQI